MRRPCSSGKAPHIPKEGICGPPAHPTIIVEESLKGWPMFRTQLPRIYELRDLYH